jgi:hypothetical protein
MESITLFGVELLPHTWPLFIGVPSLLITGAIAGCLYELLRGEGALAAAYADYEDAKAAYGKAKDELKEYKEQDSE